MVESHARCEESAGQDVPLNELFGCVFVADEGVEFFLCQVREGEIRWGEHGVRFYAWKGIKSLCLCADVDSCNTKLRLHYFSKNLSRNFDLKFEISAQIRAKNFPKFPAEKPSFPSSLLTFVLQSISHVRRKNGSQEVSESSLSIGLHGLQNVSDWKWEHDSVN